MFKFEDNRYINAGTNEFYRYGKKAQLKVKECLEPNDNGFISIKADGGKYWTFGTSNGKYGEFAKIGDYVFSVNSHGYIWAKSGTEKGDALVKALNKLLNEMIETNKARFCEDDE